MELAWLRPVVKEVATYPNPWLSEASPSPLRGKREKAPGPVDSGAEIQIGINPAQARALTRPNSFLMFWTLGREIPNSFAIAAPVFPASTAPLT
jgi:hypothetical protein